VPHYQERACRFGNAASQLRDKVAFDLRPDGPRVRLLVAGAGRARTCCNTVGANLDVYFNFDDGRRGGDVGAACANTCRRGDLGAAKPRGRPGAPSRG